MICLRFCKISNKSWFTTYRLINDQFNLDDLKLLEHEYFEARFEFLFKTDYRTAHEAAIRSGHPSGLD